MIDNLINCEGLVVYRSSPSQKADIVRFVRSQRKDQVTLAIGDGANDVNMIESAHVGIGIMGKEGNQAASFADFAVHQYSDLRRLMFWHGSNWVANMTTFVLLILLKTSVFGLSAFFYNTLAAFSGISYVTDTLFAVFSLNVTYYGFYNWFEKPISQERYRQDESKMPFKLSEIYQYHRDKAIGNWMRNFGLFMLMAYYASAIAFTVCFYCYGGRPNSKGKIRDMWGVGMQIWLLCVAFTHGVFLT